MNTINKISNTQKNALIVEGGALRSVFSSGLLDGFIQHQFNPFNFYIGVSAGAYNLLAYMSACEGKSIHIYEKFASDKRFINFTRFIRGGHLIDLDWIEAMAFDKSHIDLNQIYHQNKPLYVCLTDVLNGRPVYIDTHQNNVKSTIKASAALPLLYRSSPKINGRPMTDGGIADGIPVAEAIRLGATNIMVIRARHKSYVKKDTLSHALIRWKVKQHTNLLNTMQHRITTFEDSLSLIRNPPEGIIMTEVCPPENFNMGRFIHNKQQLIDGYHMGYNAAEKTIEEWNYKTR